MKMCYKLEIITFILGQRSDRLCGIRAKCQFCKAPIGGVVMVHLPQCPSWQNLWNRWTLNLWKNCFVFFQNCWINFNLSTLQYRVLFGWAFEVFEKIFHLHLKTICYFKFSSFSFWNFSTQFEIFCFKNRAWNFYHSFWVKLYFESYIFWGGRG